VKPAPRPFSTFQGVHPLQIPANAHGAPFAGHTFQPPKQELAESLNLFDDTEDRIYPPGFLSSALLPSLALGQFRLVFRLLALESRLSASLYTQLSTEQSLPIAHRTCMDTPLL
jgi:hypothetical protein